MFGGQGNITLLPDYVLLDHNNNILVCENYYNGRISVLNHQGHHVRYFAIKLGRLVGSMALTPNGNIWVVLYNKLQLHDGTTGHVIRSIATQHSVWGVALIADGKSVAVSFCNENKVALLDQLMAHYYGNQKATGSSLVWAA